MTTPRPGDCPKNAVDGRVSALHSAGMSQGGIAREMGVSRWQVRKAGERLGLEWNTTATAKAVQAAAEQARRDRDRLAQRYLDLSHDLLDKVEEYAADFNPDHMWQALRSSATATDKLVALQALSARYPANDDDDGMQAAMRKFDEFVQASRASAGLDRPGDH